MFVGSRCARSCDAVSLTVTRWGLTDFHFHTQFRENPSSPVALNLGRTLEPQRDLLKVLMPRPYPGPCESDSRGGAYTFKHTGIRTDRKTPQVS